MADGQDQHIDALIRELALEHQVAVGRSDPLILAYASMLKIVRTTSGEWQEAQADLQRDQLSHFEELTAKLNTDATERAERILNATLTAAKEALQTTLSASAASEAIKLETKLAPLVARATQAASLFLLAALVTLTAAAAVLWTSFQNQATPDVRHNISTPPSDLVSWYREV